MIGTDVKFERLEEIHDALNDWFHDYFGTEREARAEAYRVLIELHNALHHQNGIDALRRELTYLVHHATDYSVCRDCGGDLAVEDYTERHPYGMTYALETLTRRACQSCGEEM